MKKINTKKKPLQQPLVIGELPLKKTKCGKCEMLGDAAPCDECYRNGNYR